MGIRRSGLCALAGLAAWAASLAASPLPPFAPALFTHFGPREGLPGSSVRAVAMDSQGFLWFGTDGGLARYDGNGFKIFRRDSRDPQSLPDDRVSCLLVDGDTLWVGGPWGLARLDLQTERFLSYPSEAPNGSAGSPASWPANAAVTSLAKDGQGELWAGGPAGLGLLDPAAERLKPLFRDLADPRNFPAGGVLVLKEDREGRLWLGTAQGGLFLLELGSRRFRYYPESPHSGQAVTAIDEDASGRLWLGIRGEGLARFDPGTGRFELCTVVDPRISSVRVGEGGQVFVASLGGGLFEYDPALGTYTRYRSGSYPGSLASDYLETILEDRSGDLWLGTEGGGLCELEAGQLGCQVLLAGPEGPPRGEQSALLVDRLGYLWIGLRRLGLARRDPATGLWRRYRHAEGDPLSLPDDEVGSLHEDSRGELWVGTKAGLSRYDRGGDSFTGLGGGPESPSAILDSAGTSLWVGSFDSGLSLVNEGRGDQEARAPARVIHDGIEEPFLPDNHVTALAYDASGRLWIGTDGGLDRLDPSGRGSLVRYLRDPSRPGSLASDSIRSLFLDSRKQLWIGSSDGGLMRYEEATDSFVSYTIHDGLPSDSVESVLEDEGGRLWIATHRGLAIYDRGTGRWRALSIGGGPEGPESFTSASRGREGLLYFCAPDRIYRVDPALYAFNDHPPPVVIDSIQAPGKAEIGAAAAAKLGVLDLSWRENSVFFDFAALDFRQPGGNRYAFRLEGFDSQWSPVGADHSARYTNLPGGRYLFRVRASNQDGLWNEEGVALPVEVGYAPWSRPWVLALLALLLVGSGYALSLQRSHSALKASRAETETLLSKLIDASASMENAALVDSLTGLPNRLKLREHLELAFTRALNLKLYLALVLVDIDHFQAYNDLYGKAAGDECLRRVAQSLSLVVRRSSEILGRYGGEEFLIILEETGIEGALSEGEAARRAVEQLEIPSGLGGSGPGRADPSSIVTVSVGCSAIQPEPGHSPAFLLEAAEKALMAARQMGRNRTAD